MTHLHFLFKNLTNMTKTAILLPFSGLNRMLSPLIITAFAVSGCQTMNNLAPGSKVDRIEAQPGFVESFPDVSLEAITLDTIHDVFKVGDTASVRIYGQEAMSGSYAVDRSGNVSFPIIGTIKVAGLNTLELRQILTDTYGAQFLRDPSIAVQLETRSLGKVVVDGAVEQPGVFEIDQIINLSEAIALSGGLSEDARGKEVYIVRTINGERKVRRVDLTLIRKSAAADPRIIPNDLIFVEESVGRVAFREFLRTVPLLNTVSILATR